MLRDDQQRSDWVNQLWERELTGGIIISEFSRFLANDAEVAFCAGAELSTVLMCQAAIETHLRFESGLPKRLSYAELLERAGLDVKLKRDAERLRKFRNRWVHVTAPAEDDLLQKQPELFETECSEMAALAMQTLIRILCSNPWV